MPLFIEVRGIGFLRTSSLRRSRKFVNVTARRAVYRSAGTRKTLAAVRWSAMMLKPEAGGEGDGDKDTAGGGGGGGWGAGKPSPRGGGGGGGAKRGGKK